MGAILLFAIGLAMLILGAELVVRGASRVAVMLGVSPMFIGLTIVSIGTSAPELAVGIVAAHQDKGGLAVGNIAGTNVLNLLFIMGLSAAIRPLPLQLQIFKLELPVIVVAATLMTALAWDGRLSAMDGVILLVAGVVYTLLLITFTRRASRREKQEYSEEYGPATLPTFRASWLTQARMVAMLLSGIALCVFGAECLVNGAVRIAESFQVSTTTIGLTIVAMGTSAPELVTTLIATARDERDVAVGNLLGSSIYNILGILSVPCIVSPAGLPVESQLLWFDIPLMAGVAIGAIPVFLTGKRVSRLEGVVGVVVYIAYLVWLVTFRA